MEVVKHEWYQTPTHVILTIFAKKVAQVTRATVVNDNKNSAKTSWLLTGLVAPRDPVPLDWPALQKATLSAFCYGK